MVVNPGPERKRPLLEAFSELPVNLYVLSNPEEPWVQEVVTADRLRFCDVTDAQSVLKAAKSFGARFDGLGTYYEPSVISAALVAERFGLPGPTIKAARRSSISKVLMRTTLQESGIATPRFCSFDDLSALPAFAAKVGYPCVLKPASGADSQSVRKIETADDARALVAQAKDLTTFRKTSWWENHDTRWLLEEYLAGPLLAIDGVVADGRVHHFGATETELGPEPFFNIEVNWIPPRFDAAVIDEARNEATKVIAALGVNTAAFHAEFRLTTNGPRLIEIATRLAGGVMPQGYKQSLGIDLAALLSCLWLGQPIDGFKPRTPHRHVLQKGVFPTQEGTVQKMTGVDVVRHLPGVFEFSVVTPEGDTAIAYPKATRPIYYYGIEAATHADLLDLRQQVESTLSWTIV